MNRLDRIAMRRALLLVEIAHTREAVCRTARGVRSAVAPVTLGIAAGQALAGRPWLRAAALIGMAALTARRLFSASR